MFMLKELMLGIENPSQGYCNSVAQCNASFTEFYGLYIIRNLLYRISILCNK